MMAGLSVRIYGTKARNTLSYPGTFKGEAKMDFDKLTDILTILAVLATAGVVWITIYILKGGII